MDEADKKGSGACFDASEVNLTRYVDAPSLFPRLLPLLSLRYSVLLTFTVFFIYFCCCLFTTVTGSLPKIMCFGGSKVAKPQLFVLMQLQRRL